MDPAKAVAAAITAAHSCAACGRDFQDTYLRDFAGVPVCVDCYRDLNLLTLGELPADPDEALLSRLLSAKEGEIPAGPRARYGTVERFASRLDPDGAETLILSAARGGSATGMQEVLWIMLAADALLRSGGRNGRAPLEGREMSLLLNLAARVGMDIAWAAMLDVGVATRAADPHGEEWLYEDTIHAGGGSLEALAAEKEAFVRYMRGVKAKVDILARDAGGKRDDVDIGLGILARTADEILAAFSIMDQSGRGRSGPAA